MEGIQAAVSQLVLLLVETSPVLDHARGGGHRGRGVSTLEDTTTTPDVRCGVGRCTTTCGDTPMVVAATPVVVEDWGRLYEKQRQKRSNDIGRNGQRMTMTGT